MQLSGMGVGNVAARHGEEVDEGFRLVLHGEILT